MSWDVDYKCKLMSAHDALRCVESGMRVYIHPGCAEPETLAEALMERAPFVRDVEIVHLLTMGSAPYVAREMQGHFRHNAMFIGGNVREAVNEGRADYVPIFLSEVPSLFADGSDPLAVIRWKDIHEALEEAVDACDKGANVLEASLVKNR